MSVFLEEIREIDESQEQDEEEVWEDIEGDEVLHDMQRQYDELGARERAELESELRTMRFEELEKAKKATRKEQKLQEKVEKRRAKLEEELRRKEQLSMRLSHRIHARTQKIEALRASNNELRDSYVDMMTQASRLEADILYEEDRLRKLEAKVQSDMEEEYETTEEIREFLDKIQADVDQEIENDKADEAMDKAHLENLINIMNEQLDHFMEIERHIKSVTKQRVAEIKQVGEVDEREQHRMIELMTQKVLDAKHLLMKNSTCFSKSTPTSRD